MTRLQPFQQRAGQVRDNWKEFTLDKPLEQRQIHVARMLLENESKISDGLVLMNSENKPEWIARLRHALTMSAGSCVFPLAPQMSRTFPSAGSLLFPPQILSSRPASRRAASPESSIANA